MKNKINIKALLPFILLISIGLFSFEITYHMKVFKTLLIFISGITLLIVYYFNISTGKNHIALKNKKYFYYFLFYFIYILIQYGVTFISGETSYDRDYYLANYIALLAFSFFTFLFIEKPEDFNSGLIVISFFFLVVIIWSISDFFHFREILTIKKVFPEADLTLIGSSEKKELLKNALKITGGFASLKEIFSRLRPELSFGNTDYFSGYAVGLFPLAFITPIFLYNKEKPFYKNWLSISALIIALLSVIPLILSQTRAALFGFYIGIMLVFIPALIVMHLKKTSPLLKICFVIFFIFLFLICPLLILKYPPVFVKTVFHRLVSTINSFNFFLHDRLNGWSGALELFKAHPFFGAGLGTVYPASFKHITKYYFIYSEGNSFKHAHSEFIEALGEGGIIGLLFFLSLAGFIIFSLFKRVYSKKYIFKYRLISLAVLSGLISMLVHQLFSLSLRMSVTMSAYFFLIGISVFILSYSDKALVTASDGSEKNKNFGKKSVKKVLSLIFILLSFGFIIFFPLYSSERNLSKALPLGDIPINESAVYIEKAIKSKPDNVYARNEKYYLDLYFNIYKGYDNTIDEKFFPVIENNLDATNKIIWGYQNIWDKYIELFQLKSNYFHQKYKKTGNEEDYNEYKKSISLMLNCLEKSLNMNYLNLDNHLLRLLLLPLYQNKKQHLETVKDCYITKIFIDFAKKNRIVKEQISISFGEKNILETINKKNKKYYHFTISLKKVTALSDSLFSDLSILGDYSLLKKTVETECNNILNDLYPAAVYE